MKKFLPSFILGSIITAALTYTFVGNHTPIHNTNQPITKKTAKNQPKILTRIALISDIDHCPTRTFPTPENIQKFVDYANTQHVDLAVSLGDNIAHRLENCTYSAREDLHRVTSILENITAPTHYVLGDHDLSKDVASYTTWQEKTGKKETYYSFDINDITVIILDTVTGGHSMLPCPQDHTCSKNIDKLQEIEKALTDPDIKKKDLLSRTTRKISLERTIKEHNHYADHIKDDVIRDHGLIGEDQLLWLSHTLHTSKNKKILILADHPLFTLTTDKKSYAIHDLDKFTQILKDHKNLDKEIVSISGEVHRWKKEIIDGITYYTVNQFKSDDGSWALFEWEEDFSLYRIVKGKIDAEID